MKMYKIFYFLGLIIYASSHCMKPSLLDAGSDGRPSDPDFHKLSLENQEYLMKSVEERWRLKQEKEELTILRDKLQEKLRALQNSKQNSKNE